MNNEEKEEKIVQKPAMKKENEPVRMNRAQVAEEREQSETRMYKTSTDHIKKHGKQKSIFLLFLSASLGFLLFSCYVNQFSNSHLFLSLPSMGSDTTAPDQDFFYLDLDEDHYAREGVEAPLYEINTTEEYGDSERRDSVSNCEVIYDEEEPDGPQMFCILDIMEQELLLVDLAFVVNVPKGMCTQLITSPAWHYNRAAGRGPPLIDHSKYVPTGTEEEKNKYCVVEGGSPTTRCQDEESKILELCDFIHSTGGEEKLNCCVGEYAITGETSSTGNDWGGSIKNCMGGPGRTSWDTYTEDGIPMRLVEYVLENGLRRLVKIKNLIAVARGGAYSTPIANYLKQLYQSPEDLRQIKETDLPKFLQTHYLYTPNPYYTFTCLDSAGEILHQINLMIREWNTHEEFMVYYDSGGSDDTADPDVTGVEGNDCEYENRDTIGFNSTQSRCNDFWDFDDIAGDYRASILTTLIPNIGDENGQIPLSVLIGTGDYPRARYDQ